MEKLVAWMLWGAGVVAILASLGLGRLDYELFFIKIDVSTLLVGLVCMFAAYVRTNWTKLSKD